MIEAISGTRPLLIPNIIRIQNSNSKLAVPVRPYVAQYVQFKHIRGVPATGGEGVNIPVTKLQILDNLIEKLVGKKGLAESYTHLSGQDADQLISRLQNEYKNLTSTNSNLYQPGPDLGILLDVLA